MDGKIRRKTREESGLCIYCGINKPVVNRKGCADCLSKKVYHTKDFAARNKKELKNYRNKIKSEVIEKYGGKCECCCESDIEFLAIDHKNNDGYIERRKLYGSNGSSSYSWYLKLRREPIRSDLRVLCHNCNLAIAFYGYCPHQGRPVEEKIETLTKMQQQIINQMTQGLNMPKFTKSIAGSLGSLVKRKILGVVSNSFVLTEKGRKVYEQYK